MIICSECGAELKEGARFCMNCGKAASMQTEAGPRQEQTIGQTTAGQETTADYYGYEYCKRCQTRLVDKSDNPESVLCKQCREELIHYPIPKWIYFVAGGILLLLLISFSSFPANLKNYRAIEGAEKKADQGYIYSTLNDMNEILEKNPTSTKVAIKMVDVAMEHGYYDYATYIFNNYLVNTEVSDTEYDKLMAYSEELDRYYNAYDAYDAMMAEQIEAADTSDESTSGSLTLSEQISEEIIEQLKMLENDPSYDAATLYYYMGYTALDDSERCEYFETCYEMDPTYTDAAAQASNSYRRAGDLVNARSLLEQAYDEDKESPTVIRSLAVVELLEGNLEKGLSFAETAYDLNPEEYYVADTYIIALVANGDVDAAVSLKEDLEAEGYEFDEELQRFIDGECTLEEYYIGI